jgi:hypothetical protein
MLKRLYHPATRAIVDLDVVDPSPTCPFVFPPTANVYPDFLVSHCVPEYPLKQTQKR